MFLSLCDDVLALFDKQNVDIRVFNLLLQRERDEELLSRKLQYVNLQFIF